jgi:hypothetical protein
MTMMDVMMPLVMEKMVVVIMMMGFSVLPRWASCRLLMGFLLLVGWGMQINCIVEQVSAISIVQLSQLQHTMA